MTKLLAVLGLLLLGCTTTYVGKAIHQAVIQRDYVVECTKEAIKMHMVGQLTDDQFVVLAGRYQEWADDQTQLAAAMAEWQIVASAENTARLNAALDTAGKASQSFLTFLAKLGVDIDAVGARMNKPQSEVVPSTPILDWDKIATLEVA